MPNITTNHAIIYTNLFMFGGGGGSGLGTYEAAKTAHCFVQNFAASDFDYCFLHQCSLSSGNNKFYTLRDPISVKFRQATRP